MRLLLPEVREVSEDELPDLYDVPAGPSMRAGLVASLDGAAAVESTSRPLSGPADLQVFRALRTVADAVLVGAGTARAEDYGPVQHRPAAATWRDAHGRTPQAVLVVVSNSGRVPPGALPGPLLLVCPASAQVPEGVTALRAGDTEVDLPEAVRQLHGRGLSRLLCEGGPQLLTSMLSAGLVDELCLTTSPWLVGSGPRLVDDLQQPVGLELVSLLHAAPGPLLGRWRVVPSGGA